MTACVNKKSKRVAAVVTASLVGALSIGAPAVAMAAGNGDIQLLATDPSAINNATVAYKGGVDGATFTYNGRAQGLTADTLTPKGGSDVQNLQLLPATNQQPGYYYFYVDMNKADKMAGYGISNVEYKNASGILTKLTGEWITTGMPKEIGNYAVVSGYWSGSAWTCADLAATFKIVPQSLSSATLFEGNDVEDNDFAWNGYAGSNTAANLENGNESLHVDKMGVALDGVRLDSSADYTLNILNLDGTDAVNIMPGTTYRAHIVGQGNFAGQVKDVEFTFGKCDLSKASITGKVQISAPSTLTVDALVKSINGNATTSFDTNGYAIQLVSGPDGGKLEDTSGKYTFKIKANADAKYFSGEQTFTYVKADKVADVKYDGDAFPTSKWSTDLSEATVNYFDVTKISATVDSDKVPADQVKVAVTKADGSAATAADLKTPGKYNVSVDVYYTDANKQIVAQQESVAVDVFYSVAEETDVFFTYEGENVVSSAEDEYTGEDLSKKMAVKVYAGSKELAEGTDYTVLIEKKQSDGKWAAVESVVDAGDYRFTIKPITFQLTGGDGMIEFEVTQAVLAAVPNGTVTDRDKDGDAKLGTFLPYTGSAIDVTFSFLNKDGEKVAIDSYDVVISKKGETKKSVVKDKDFYTATFSGISNDNYKLASTSVNFKVREAKSFGDVKNSDWYVGSVYQAKENGYVNGLRGTELFAPKATITRADVACILFNMAGGETEFEGHKNEMGGYETGFSDVDSHEYYALAIQWAKQAGVVNGYGDGTFNPLKQITREEFASMLANYAKALGDDVTVDDVDGVLGAYDDADTVSDWAESNVAWAVENGVMGNGGFIKGNGAISRAEVASMAVNYQAEPLK